MAKTRFQRFLEKEGIDNFEYEKIVPNGKAWNNLMDKWHKEVEDANNKTRL